MNERTVSVRIPVSLHHTLRVLAARRGTTIKVLATDAVTALLAALKGQSK